MQKIRVHELNRTKRDRDGVRSWVVFCGVLWTVALGLACHQWGYVADAGTRMSTYVVQPGDSVWSIASRLSDGNDPRSLMDEIESLNHLTGNADIQPGQALEVPAAR